MFVPLSNDTAQTNISNDKVYSMVVVPGIFIFLGNSTNCLPDLHALFVFVTLALHEFSYAEQYFIQLADNRFSLLNLYPR